MNQPLIIPPPQLDGPLPDRERLMITLGNGCRWAMVRAMATGESFCAGDLVPIAGCQASAVTKHIRVLLDSGIVIHKGLRLYRLAPRYLPAPGQNHIDFSHIICRLDPKPAASQP